ncbi:hypothetical protein HMPREF9518_00701 [Enterococcus faecalis TX1342]|nr:hypothetical protein HMPREF9518_00701 [Enterococcus faecalis TX1342]
MLISEKLKKIKLFSKIFFAFEITAVDLLIFFKSGASVSLKR